jgi:hypothetical protein
VTVANWERNPRLAVTKKNGNQTTAKKYKYSEKTAQSKLTIAPSEKLPMG